MKKYIITILISLFIICTSNATLTTVTWANNHSPTAGEFIMTQADVPTFHTFCMEENQYVNIGGTYFYQISNATDGGVNGGPDPISIGTAWLYTDILHSLKRRGF